LFASRPSLASGEAPTLPGMSMVLRPGCKSIMALALSRMLADKPHSYTDEGNYGKTLSIYSKAIPG